jgi:hypothetical protein
MLHPPTPYTVEMDESLFGHIHNDYRLGGTTFEGNSFTNTAQYLAKVLLDMQDSDSNEILSNTLKNLQKFIEIQKDLLPFEAAKDSMKTNKLIQIMQPTLISSIDRFLNEEKEIIIPAGWSGKPQGHAMILKITKEAVSDKEEKLRFSIFNSGEGIQFHEYIEDLDKTQRFKPTFVNELICHKDKSTTAISQILSKVLFDLRFHDILEPHTEKMDGKQFYQKMMMQFIEIGAQQVTTPDAETVFIGGQRSGTCSWKSLCAFLKSELAERPDLYKKINYTIKLKSLSEFYENCLQRTKLNDTNVQWLLTYGISNLSRRIQKLISNHDYP